MNLYSSSSFCGNCGKQTELIVAIDIYKTQNGGKIFFNVD